jgi:hypothetical protein
VVSFPSQTVVVQVKFIVRHPLDDRPILQISLTIHRRATTFPALEHSILFAVLCQAAGVLLAHLRSPVHKIDRISPEKPTDSFSVCVLRCRSKCILFQYADE